MDPMRYQNKWLMGIEIIVMIVFVLIMVIPSPSPPRRSAKARCMSNMYQIWLAMQQYYLDYDEGLPIPRSSAQLVPEAQSWRGMLAEYVTTVNTWRCPKLNDRMAYSLNRSLVHASPPQNIWKRVDRQIETADTFSNTVLFFESVNDDPRNNNLNGDTISRPTADRPPVVGSYVIWPDEGSRYFRNWPEWARPRHGDRTLVLYLDGHVTYDTALSFPPTESRTGY